MPDQVFLQFLSDLSLGHESPFSIMEPCPLTNTELVVGVNSLVNKGKFSVGVSWPPGGAEAISSDEIPVAGVLGEDVRDDGRDLGGSDSHQSSDHFKSPEIV